MFFSALRKGTVQKKHPFRYVVLSTTKNNAPKSRWVVFRKLDNDNRFVIFTDKRSDKYEEIDDNPQCSLLYYHNRQGLQIRFDGKAQLHYQDDLTSKYWPGVKGNGIKSYSTVLSPGTKIEDISEGNQWLEDPDDRYFSIIEFVPDRMDVLQLDRVDMIRAAFNLTDEGWKGSYLVP